MVAPKKVAGDGWHEFEELRIYNLQIGFINDAYGWLLVKYGIVLKLP